MSSVYSQRLLDVSEELEEGRVSVASGRTRGASSESGGVASPHLEGTIA